MSYAGKLCGAAAVGMMLALASGANATVIKPAPNPADGDLYTVTPGGFTQSAYSNDSNADIGNQSPGNVETVLESPAWFGTPLTFVGGGACGGSGVTCSGGDGSITTGGAQAFGVHYDNKFLAFFYNTAITTFSISGLDQGVSNLYAFVPLPGALALMLTALGGLFGLQRWRQQVSEPTTGAGAIA
jgi:hypothetical protein